ncbi:NAD(P)H-quinone oxidoreductase [Saccharomonospora sp. CUA-673]|uniref:NAD(P)H-quinone oxidoreductase n=1 Tax=Saccharomonospora sp. CUA-673 TaxID=1904969 RepID=UPI000966230C|nr:NAD(P)H-quinone oxidoreductase [Saccharomonospora sp. CUA-673]OLT39082.1 NAD(P)H-quinone oxidoreductase [Saccharomonospora sp. CUA-673]
MRAITIREPGPPENLVLTEVPDPEPAPGEVLLDVAATAVNRADVMQRMGKYPPPPGASELLGLECSGTITELGEGVTGWQVGDEVCALLAGGGYAEKAAVPAGQLLPLPSEVGLVSAAGLPEVACTVWSNLVMHAGMSEDDVVLVHGGAGGIGTHAIQVAKALGATVAVTAGSAERLENCRQLGADITVDYREQDFVAELAAATGGADIVLDNMGAKYLDRNIDVLRDGGHLVIIGMQGGIKGELNIAKLLGKRGTVSATALRSRSLESKAEIVADVRTRLWPLIDQGTVLPVIDQVLPLEDAARAHRTLDEGGVFGKIILTAK